MKHVILATALATGLAGAAAAQSWDMPTPYGDATFHTQNIMQFADDVRAATDGAHNFHLITGLENVGLEAAARHDFAVDLHGQTVVGETKELDQLPGAGPVR